VDPRLGARRPPSAGTTRLGARRIPHRRWKGGDATVRDFVGQKAEMVGSAGTMRGAWAAGAMRAERPAGGGEG
jgi:hypothetical protein